MGLNVLIYLYKLVTSDIALILNYMMIYFQKNENYDIFIPYYDEKKLKELFSKTKLYQGI